MVSCYRRGPWAKNADSISSIFIFPMYLRDRFNRRSSKYFSERPDGKSLGGYLMTALIVAGGSSAVFTLFDKLGLRNPLERRQAAENMRKESNRSLFPGNLSYKMESGNLLLEISGLNKQKKGNERIKELGGFRRSEFNRSYPTII